MFQELRKSVKIEVFFWLVVAFVFSPRILLEVYEYKLKKSLIPFENNEWTVKEKDGDIIYDQIKLPLDLRWKEQKTNRREWILEKDVQVNNLANIKNLGIVLGRVGDSDYAMFNQCIIGSTAYNLETKKTNGWGWSFIRVYQIPQSCINQPNSKITYHIFKVFGPGYGLYSGPLGFGDFDTLSQYIQIYNFFKYSILSIFGLGLIFFIGVQYFFVYLISKKREVYGIFSILTVFVGIYLFITSLIPFFLIKDFFVTVKALFVSAFFATIFLLRFFNQKFKVFKRIFFIPYLFAGGLLLLIGVFQNEMNATYNYYEYWHPLFLISFTICCIQMWQVKSKNENNIYFNKYLLALTGFVICCFHDVIVSVFAFSNSYIIGYGFTFLVFVVGLNLSREYSDAFDKTEEQVINRTRELGEAIMNIKKLQIGKDEQAKRFAHDIRSPLAALQVLRTTITENLSEDQKKLLKHTITRINDLANTTLPKLINGEKDLAISSVFLWSVTDRIVSEKRIEFQHIPNIFIELRSIVPIFELHGLCDESELMRIISNLINNAVESRKENSQLNIFLTLRQDNQFIQIDIEDNGIGIPELYLPKIFEEGFTYGKKSGKGIGLKSAKKIIESWNGAIYLHSAENAGTIITLKVLKAAPPDWLITQLDLSGIKDLVIIDDQPYSINTWKEKCDHLEKKISIHWIQDFNIGTDEIAHFNRTTTKFLVDYDLTTKTSGIDFILKLKILQHAILVTANDDDPLVRKQSQDNQIPILPKSLIHAIPIQT